MSQVADIFEKDIPNSVEKNRAKVANLEAAFKFNITGDEGAVYKVAINKGDCAVEKADETATADCTLTMETQNFLDMIDGKIKPMGAVMTKKLKIEGQLALAMKLEALFG